MPPAMFFFLRIALTVLGYSVSLLLFLFHWFYVSVFMPVPYCSGYYSFVIHCEIKECDASTLCSFSSLLWLCEVFCGSIQILGLFFSVSVKNDTGILIRIALTL